MSSDDQPTDDEGEKASSPSEPGADPPVPPTRRDVPATRRDGSAVPPTSRDAETTAGEEALLRLPTALEQTYDVEHELEAAGGESDLLVVRERRTGDRFVVKIYRRGYTVEPQLLEQVARLDPHHVVRVVAWGQSDGRYYEVLEYLPKGSLADLLQAHGGPMAPGHVRDILADLAAALRCLHEAGIVHRDLKPANVLLRTAPGDRTRRVLGDFGLAVASQESLVFLSASRTFHYAAPEAASGAVSPARDYWSLGMIVLELLTGSHPFAGLSEAVITAQLATRPVDTRVVEDPRWRNLCRGLLVRDPRQRWGAEEVDAWLDGADPEVHDDSGAAPTTAQTPYRIGDAAACTNEELARALANNWSEAKDRIGRNLVLDWIEKNWLDTNAVAAAHRALTDPGDAETRLYRLIHALDPSAAPTFRGRRLDEAGLAGLADAAAAGDDGADEAVRALRRVANALAEAHTDSHLPELVTTWVESTTALRDVAAEVSRHGGPSIADEVLATADLQLLSVAVRPDGLSVLRDRAVAAQSSEAREQRWYAALGDPGTASASELILAAILAPDAVRRTDEDRARKSAQAAQLAARRRREQQEREQAARAHRRLAINNAVTDVGVVAVWPFVLIVPMSVLGAFGDPPYYGPFQENLRTLPWVFAPVAGVTAVVVAALNLRAGEDLDRRPQRVLESWGWVPAISVGLGLVSLFLAAIIDSMLGGDGDVSSLSSITTPLTLVPPALVPAVWLAVRRPNPDERYPLPPLAMFVTILGVSTLSILIGSPWG